MNKNPLLLFVTIGLVLTAGVVWFSFNREEAVPMPNTPSAQTPTEPGSEEEPGESAADPDIKLDSFKAYDSVSSPLTITGSARGTWFFEASFPINVVDQNGKVIATTIAEAQSNWMTENFVPFKAVAFFTVTTTQPGEIVFKKDNPSGLPEHDKELRIPVTLVASTGPQRTVKLFYYNQMNDQDASGNTLCSSKGLVVVERQVSITNTPIQDTLKLLLRGEISFPERQQGIGTEYPLPGLELKGALLKDSVLTLEFADPNNKTSGGSCRTNVLRAQIEATAKQFLEVKEVKFKPAYLFQP